MDKPSIDFISRKCYGFGHYACNDTVSGDGRIYIPYGDEKGINSALISTDNGKSFEKTDIKINKDISFQKLSDGTFLGIGFSVGEADIAKIYNPDFGEFPYCLAVYRADSFEDVTEGRVSTDLTVVRVPGLTAGYGDSANRFVCGASGWRELSNGDILLTMYGHTNEDTTLCPYFQKSGVYGTEFYDFYLYRTFCLVSHDKGKSFEFLSTLADCQTYPIADVNAEGYCETDIIELEAGHILAVIRTGGHEVKSPLYACHSFDRGKTWDTPSPISEWGVLPRILKMKSGRLVVITGHPDVFIIVSDDGGKTWSDRVLIQEDPGFWGETSCGYSSIFECEDGVISVVYDAAFEAKKELPKGSPFYKYLYTATFRLN